MKSIKINIGSLILQSELLTTNKDILEDELLIIIGLITMALHLTLFFKLLNKQLLGFKVKFFFLFTIEDPENIIVVHCNSGKGRTGTAICAILIYMGYCSNMDDCLRFYGH